MQRCRLRGLIISLEVTHIFHNNVAPHHFHFDFDLGFDFD